MIVCREKSKQSKIQRDFLERNHTKEEAAFMFEKQSWPAAIKWVFSKRFRSHINIIHGTFNKHKYEILFRLIVSFLISRTPIKIQESFQITAKTQNPLFLDKRIPHQIFIFSGYSSFYLKLLNQLISSNACCNTSSPFIIP